MGDSKLIFELDGKRPKIHPKVSFIAKSAKIIGDVEIGEGCVIFDNVVLEGIMLKIKIGAFTNIQSGTIIHGLPDSDTIIGNYCTIGHNSIIHGCTLKDYSTVGLGSTVMAHTTINEGGFVAAGSLIPERKEFPENALIMGRPGKVVKILTEGGRKKAKEIAVMYSNEGKHLKSTLKEIPFEDCINKSVI